MEQSRNNYVINVCFMYNTYLFISANRDKADFAFVQTRKMQSLYYVCKECTPLRSMYFIHTSVSWSKLETYSSHHFCFSSGILCPYALGKSLLIPSTSSLYKAGWTHSGGVEISGVLCHKKKPILILNLEEKKQEIHIPSKQLKIPDNITTGTKASTGNTFSK